MKNLTVIMAIVAMAVTSCAKDEEVSGTSSDQKHNPNEIGFRANTTRATVVDLPALKASSTGFVVYATSGGSPTGWYPNIDGTNNYKYTTSWGWSGTAPLWPTAPSGYPMKFYAYFATSYTGLTFTPNPPTPAAMVAGTYKVQPEATQVDFLAATASAISTKPASGMLSLTFNHILSKINFGVVPGAATTAYVQSVGVNKVGDQRVYNFVNGDWVAQPLTFTANYTYKTTTTPAISLIGEATESVAQPIAATNPTSLMLMPQTGATWNTTLGAPAAAYMGLIYRLQTTTDPNAVGYEKADNHPNYATLGEPAKTNLHNKPLFVSVGYPFAPTSMTWDKGKGYTYNIFLGTANATNGYVVSGFYYDENGQPTTLPIIGKNPGDPISSGTINFNVDVVTWADQPGTPIQ